MKKLMPIQKLYNFISKVFKNFCFSRSYSKNNFAFLFFFTSVLLLTFKVDALREAREVLNDGTPTGVYYLGSKFGEDTNLDPDIMNGSYIPLADGCYYNGVRTSAIAPMTVFDESINKFTDVYNTQLAAIPNNEIKAQIGNDGFCVGVRPCKIDSSGKYIKDDAAALQYVLFKNQGGWRKVVLRQAVSFWAWDYIDRPGFPITPFTTIQECNKKRADENSETSWYYLDGSRVKRTKDCYEAVREKLGRNDEQSKEICAKFMCSSGNTDIKSDWQDNVMSNVGGFNFDGSSSDVGTCQWLDTRTECKFLEPSDANFLYSCTYDVNPATPANCATENKIVETTSIGLTTGSPFANKKMFCAPNNKPVFCDSGASVNTYARVFDTSTSGTPPVTTIRDTIRASMSSSCAFATRPTSISCALPGGGGPGGAVTSPGASPGSTTTAACNLPAPTSSGDPTSCCFGSGATSCSTARTSRTSSVSGKTIYCSSDNKVIRCNGATVRNYFPVTTSGSSPVTLPSVFRSSADMTSSNIQTDCEIVTDTSLASPGGSASCLIPTTSTNCTFGNTSTRDNCYDANQYQPYTSSTSGADQLNLFCNGSNITIACKDDIVDYRVAFPASAGRNSGPFTPLASGCIAFVPNMDSIPAEAMSQCDVEGERRYGTSADTSEAIDDATNKDFTKCVVDKVKSGRSPGTAQDECVTSKFGAGARFYECACDVSYNADYDFLLCATGVRSGSDCDEVCILQSAELKPIVIQKKVDSVSPIGFLNTIANFLFGIAIIIFIINMLRGSFVYVSSGGDEGKMKEAQALITNSVFGMIFIVFIGSVLRWIIEVMSTVITG